MKPDELTPVEMHGGIYFKRDDYFVIDGACGGKARTADYLLNKGCAEGYTVFVTTGSRDSRQCDIVSAMCEARGLECHLFMPSGKDTDVTLAIESRPHSVIHRGKVGYTNVLISYAQKWAKENNACYIPFGMEDVASIRVNQHQVSNIPRDCKRIVVACGGGMNMVSILSGLSLYDINIPVTGVQVGKDPTKTIEEFLGVKGLFYDYDLVQSELPYGKHPAQTSINGVELDAVYEAKCIPFLQQGDLMWIIGKK